MDRRQKRAYHFENCIKRRLDRIDHDWKRIAHWLSIIFNEKLYEEWDFANFSDYAESIGISKSLAYDLVGIQNSIHREKLEELPISHARLVLRALNGYNPDEVAELIDDIKPLTWHDARQRLYGDDLPQEWHSVHCPSCGTKLRSTKAVTLEVDDAKIKRSGKT